jgi:hypothetical protein
MITRRITNTEAKKDKRARARAETRGNILAERTWSNLERT